MTDYNRANNGRMETAIKSYEKDAKIIVLASNIHGGSMDYYENIEFVLDGCDHVMFEGVKGNKNKGDGKEKKGGSLSLGALAMKAYGMFQAYHIKKEGMVSLSNAIDFRNKEKKHGWVNVDVTASELVYKLKERSGEKDFFNMSQWTKEVYEEHDGKSPLEKEAAISNALGERAHENGFMDVIVNWRNSFVNHELRKLQSDPPEMTGVLYGAGHMHGLEKFVVDELGYRLIDEIWIPQML